MQLSRFPRLVYAYLEPHRYWHNLQHPTTMLQWGGNLVTREQFWAIWYHDAIWAPLAEDNEEQSADLAVDDLEHDLPASRVELIKQIILDTKDHKPRTDESRLVLDLDIYALAQPFDRYQQYAADIRAEYGMVPWETYREKRMEFLRKMLNRATLFYTPEFRALGDMARFNMQRELHQLEAGPR